MGQEFFINSQALQDKISELLPSQGGAGAGFDLSASTQIIPIIDLTESASGSNLRQDLQVSLSLTSITEFTVNNATSTIINNTGYWRIYGTVSNLTGSTAYFRLTDGVTTKIITRYLASTSQYHLTPFDFIIFLQAGESCTVQSDNASSYVYGNTRQIATIDGILVNP